MIDTYFWNSVTISSKLNSLAATHDSTDIRNLSSLSPCNDRQGSNFISFCSSSIIKSLLRVFDFISTWGSTLAFLAHCPFTSFRSHMLNILSCNSQTSPDRKANWNHESYFLNPSDLVLASKTIPTSTRHCQRRFVVWDHIFVMHRGTRDEKIWFAQYKTYFVYNHYHYYGPKLKTLPFHGLDRCRLCIWHTWNMGLEQYFFHNLSLGFNWMWSSNNDNGGALVRIHHY